MDGMELERTFDVEPGPGMPTPPEKRLALSIMASAIGDFIKYQDRADEDAARLRDEAEEWILSADERWPFSFQSICDLLDLPAERIRSIVLDEAVELQGVSPQDLVRLVGNG
jgi:hypothetical protein